MNNAALSTSKKEEEEKDRGYSCLESGDRTVASAETSVHWPAVLLFKIVFVMVFAFLQF
jgi:hypothetical protein